MHYTFHEYLEVRVLAEWEQMIEESKDSSLNQDVSVLVRNFIQKLDGYLPQGIKTLGTNAINKVRQVLNTYKFRGLEGIDPKQILTQVANQIKSVTPDPQVIAIVNKTLKELLTEVEYRQGVKRRKMAQFRSERPTQGLEIAPGTDHIPQQPVINPSINTSQAMG